MAASSQLSASFPQLTTSQLKATLQPASSELCALFERELLAAPLLGAPLPVGVPQRVVPNNSKGVLIVAAPQIHSVQLPPLLANPQSLITTSSECTHFNPTFLHCWLTRPPTHRTVYVTNRPAQVNRNAASAKQVPGSRRTASLLPHVLPLLSSHAIPHTASSAPLVLGGGWVLVLSAGVCWTPGLLLSPVLKAHGSSNAAAAAAATCGCCRCRRCFRYLRLPLLLPAAVAATCGFSAACPRAPPHTRSQPCKARKHRKEQQNRKTHERRSQQ